MDVMVLLLVAVVLGESACWVRPPWQRGCAGGGCGVGKQGRQVDQVRAGAWHGAGAWQGGSQQSGTAKVGRSGRRLRLAAAALALP